MKAIKTVTAFIIALALIAGAAGCASRTNDGDDDTKLKVVATVFPLYDWAREIIKDDVHAKLELLLDNGVDLHSYQPSAEDIVTISSADVFIYVGGESEAWVSDVLKSAMNPDIVVLNLLEVIGDGALVEEELDGMTGEDEDEDGDETVVEYDEHIWLSLENAKKCCRAICDVLKTADAAHAETYENNLTAYTEELSSLSDEYTKVCEGSHVLLFADRFPFAYLTAEFGIKPYAAFPGCSAETEASFETVSFLAEKLCEYKLPYVVTIDGSDAKISDTVIAAASHLGYDGEVKCAVLNSMQSTTTADVSAGVTYISVMEYNLETLKTVFDAGR